MTRETDSSKTYAGDKEDLRHILQTQQNRIHHIQSLSQGLLGANIAVVTIAATIFLTYADSLPDIPTEADQYTDVANSTLIAGPHTVQWTIVVSQLVAYTFIALAFISLIISISKLYNVFTSSKMDMGAPFEKSEVIGPDPLPISVNNRSKYPPISGEFEKAIQRNQTHINSIEEEFIRGALRLFTFPIFLISSIYVYYWAMTIRPGYLFLMCLVMVVTGSVPSYFASFVLRWNSGFSNGSTSFIQELFTGQGRWKRVDIYPVEGQLFDLVAVLAFLIVVSWALSALVQIHSFLL